MSSSPEEQAFESTEDALGIGPLSYEALAVEADAQRTRADNLLVALETSRTIGMAIGILMKKNRGTAERAYGRLREARRLARPKLRDIADEVLHTGDLPTALPDNSSSEPQVR